MGTLGLAHGLDTLVETADRLRARDDVLFLLIGLWIGSYIGGQGYPRVPAFGFSSKMQIFAADYDTRDGTCVRDYIHVTDLAEAHLAVLGWLRANGPLALFNCGYGRGYTVREVLGAVERAAGTPLAAREAPRRPGDPPALVADARRLCERVGWQARLADLETIVQTALAWERSLR